MVRDIKDHVDRIDAANKLLTDHLSDDGAKHNAWITLFGQVEALLKQHAALAKSGKDPEKKAALERDFKKHFAAVGALADKIVPLEAELKKAKATAPKIKAVEEKIKPLDKAAQAAKKSWDKADREQDELMAVAIRATNVLKL